MGQAMSFVHPLARGAKVWTAKDHDDGERRVLVIVTTIPLDPEQKGYKKSLVEKLSRAAREHLAESKEAEIVHADQQAAGMEPAQGLTRSGEASEQPLPFRGPRVVSQFENRGA